MNRRTFIALTAGAAAFPRALLASDERRARIGLLTDTHILGTRESCALVEKAYRLFRDRGVGAIFHLGDLADRWMPEAYAHYTAIRHETYPVASARPKEVYSFGYHDANFYLGRPLAPTKAGRQANAAEAWADVRTRLEAAHEMRDRFTFAGYTFLVFPQWPDPAKYEAMVEAACRDNPDRPVFILEHIPPFGVGHRTTCYDGFEEWTRPILARHPQVVLLYGHVHANLRDPRNVWQGEFTSVNCGCLQSYDGGDYAGRADTRRCNRNVLTMDLFDDRAELTRWDLDEMKPFGETWTLAWPYGGTPARYAPSAQSVRTPVPSFSAEARVSAVAQDDGSAVVSFPAVSAYADDTHHYQVELFRAGEREPYARVDEPGPWRLRPSERPASASLALPSGLFDPGVETRLAVTPVNAFGRGGAPLGCVVRTVDAGWRTVWSGSPAGTPCAEYPEGVEFFPPPAAWAGAKGTRFRVTFDFAADADAHVWFRRLEPFGLADARLVVAGLGADTFRRYTAEFVKQDDGAAYSVWVNNTVAKSVRLRNLRVDSRDV